MRKIPKALQEDMADDPYYKRCCVSGSSFGKIDWHHNLIFGGRQVNEKFCILPLSKPIHDNIHKYKEQCDWIMLNRATDEELARYSKAIDYKRMRNVLNEKYGKYGK